MLATLTFWGWQSGYLIFAVVMGAVLESARLIKGRLELSDTDFRRIVNFCTLFTLAAMFYVFTTAPAGGAVPRGSFAGAEGAIEISSRRASTAFLQWQPMFLFVFVAAQTFSTREKIPLTAISLISRWRSRQNQKLGNAPAGFSVNIAYPYFIVCLFSASVHANAGTGSYFWGQDVLLTWALWPLRSRRFGIPVWLCLIVVAAGIGFCGQYGIGREQRLLEGYGTQWMGRFFKQRTEATHGVTAIGEIGRLKLSARIVIWLKPNDSGPPPTYLREASYRSYHSQSWYAGSSQKDFAETLQDFNSGNWNLLPEKTNTLAVNIACYLAGRSPDTGDPQGLLPLPTGSRRLENLPASTLKKSKTGAVLAAGQSSLIMFDALYSPGATIDSPPDTNWDTSVPAGEVPALDRVISEMKISGANDARKILAVRQFFSSKFVYSTWLGPDKVAGTNETPLGRFLLASRSGHCEYFATATVLLLRELGIPARYAVGYYVHEGSGDKHYVVREHDAHAWCLVWDQTAKTWQDFDTTPTSWIAIEGQRDSFLKWFSDSWSWIQFEVAQFEFSQSKSNPRQYILWGLVPVMAFLLYQMVFRRGHQRQQQKQSIKTSAPVSCPGLDSEFYLFESQLSKRGRPCQPGETLSDWLAGALADPALVDLRKPLAGLVQLHYGHRFDPRGLSSEDRQALKREADACLETLTRVNRDFATRNK
jgi:hypothetical protein